ncbi:MAG TPA: menaquinone biosynthesis protein [Chitinophagaceae bacterium]|nr:menaquinone biosynthesis protein [Chitinophagaceae bacterium]
MINVAAVSYLNTKPLLHGIQRSPIKDKINLNLDYPSRIAEGLMNGQYDVGLVPVAIIPELPNWFLVSDYGIAAHGPVASVSIFSEKPIEELDTIYLDYQSRTSVRLAQVLVREYLKLSHIKFEAAPDNYIDLIKDNVGGVIIGDRALIHKHRFAYDFDLAEHWYHFTKKPFVFAAWISTKPLPEKFIQAFNEANREGLNQLDQVIQENPIDYYDLHTYYIRDIKYFIGKEEKEGLDAFLSYIKSPAIL